MLLIGKRVGSEYGILTLLLMILFSSCSVQQRIKVKEYPKNKPFVYSTKINIVNELPKDEEKRLTYELENYWDDSLRVRLAQRYLAWYRLSKPPAFDSVNIDRSVNFMKAYLNSQGYFYPHFKDSIFIDTVKDQLRASVIMDISTGKNITIDSVSYNFQDSALNALVQSEISKSLLKKGGRYTKQVIGNELDRLTNLFRQNGYYNFSRDDLRAVVDTLGSELLELTLDPFKQAQLIADAAKKRNENPTWDIMITTTRVLTDSTGLKQVSFGNIYYYPETNLYDIPDSVKKRNDFIIDTFRSGIMKYNQGIFRFRPMREHTYFKRGDKYNEADYFKTLNTLGQLGAWQQVDAILEPRDKDSLDVHLFMVPATKQSVSAELEGSRNSGDVITGNTLGISMNLSYNNKNRWKQAIQQQTVLRTGVELNLLNQANNPLLQTFLVSASHTYAFPRILTPFRSWGSSKKVENKKTLLTLNGSYIDRRNFYKVNSITASIGYEWRSRKRNGDHLWLYKPLNLELYGITRLAGLDTLIQKNPFLQASFNEGNIVSQSLSFISTGTSRMNRNRSHYFRVGIEEAGGLFGLLPGLKNNIYRYIKTETEYRQVTRFDKSELAYRAFAGVGYNYGNDPRIGRTLPFFKQFIAGGPYSMRAWGLRQLGLGSSIFSDTVNSSYRDRFGDIQLESNIEYRFTLLSLGSFKVGSAFFADIGNIWNIKRNNQDPESKFSLSNLGRDLAIGVGTGLRFDFSYFLIRFDFAYRVKDPARNTNGGWMSIRNFVWSETRSSGLKINNMALQFGIGLPF
ncbi:MAG: hypothetical protein RLZZ429_372 [Bacteroidota bacterium]